MKKKALIIIPYDEPGEAYTREMRCQEKKEILGTRKPPLTPAIIAALFERDSIPFAVIENTPPGIAAAQLAKTNFHPDLVVFPTCTPTVARDMLFISELKTLLTKHNSSRVTTAAFGSHTSGVPKETLEEYDVLDIAIAGEPEETILELASAEKELDDIKGIAWRRADSSIVLNPRREGVADLDSLPTPAWDNFDISGYRVPLFGKKFLAVEVSRGCPYSCSFCVVPLTHGAKVRERAPEKIVEELKFLKQKYNTSFFYLWGDTAVFRRAAIEEFCDRVITANLGIQWISNTRPEAIQDMQLAEKLHKSGCRMLSMGAETADPAILETMGKRLDIDALRRSIAILKTVKIRSFVFFIFGYPGETRATMANTLRLALDLDPDYANFYPAVPYPGTALWDYCIKNDLLADRDWRNIDFSSYILKSDSLSSAQVMEMVRGARLKFYLRPKYIIKSMRDLASPARAVELIKAAPAYLGI